VPTDKNPPVTGSRKKPPKDLDEPEDLQPPRNPKKIPAPKKEPPYGYRKVICYKTVTCYETRTVKHVKYCTVYDECGCPCRVARVCYRDVQVPFTKVVPVVKWVKVCYRPCYPVCGPRY
jgi:hypothetical protein